MNFDNNTREKYFTPYRIIASGGYDNPRWVIDNQSAYYSKLWRDARVYMKAALAIKPSGYLPVSEWGKLIANRSFVFEFKTDINMDLITWFLNMDEASPNGPYGVYKMIISPEEDLNYNTNTIYLRDNSGIYKYSLTFIPGMITRTEYSDIFAQLKQNTELNQYSVIKEKFNMDSIGQDILGVISGPKYGTYSNVTCSVPDGFKAGNAYTSSDVDSIADNVLGAEKYGYDRSWDAQNTIEFRTLNNVYKIYSDGFLEYKNLLKPSEDDKGNVKDAFLKAVLFLNRIKFLAQEEDVKLYLTRIEDKGVNYKFTFNYLVHDIPVFFDYTTKSESRKYMSNAFEIEATAKNVLSCYGVVKSFQMDKESKEYNLAFSDLIDDAIKVHGYDEFRNFEDIFIKDIYVSYKVEYGAHSQKLMPVWVIKTSEKFYTIPMRKK